MNIGTWVYTLFNGKQIGVDESGNRYFYKKGKTLNGRERRWVLFKGRVEASTVPAEWHAWLHHTVDEPLTLKAATAKSWQQPHNPNLTGTSQAYLPPGHQLHNNTNDTASSDYEAWNPNQE